MKTRKFDKRITRLANSGATSVRMFNQDWELSPGTWGVRVPTKRFPDRKPEVYQIDGARYLDPRTVGGLCILWSDAYNTRLIR